MEQFNKKLKIWKLIKKRDKMEWQIFYWQENVKILEVEEEINKLTN